MIKAIPMKKKIILILTVTILYQCTSKTSATSIPLGRWNYKLLVNGNKVGDAVFTNRLVRGSYISKTEMKIKFGLIENSTEQIITESADFKPLKIEIYNKIISADGIQEINTVAEFKGRTVNITTGKNKTSIKISKPFILDGNFFMSQLIKTKFKRGSEISALIYDPSIEMEEPVKVTVKVEGRKEIAINNKKEELIYIIQSIENFKTIDLYIDSRGITKKAVIKMLNNRFELIIKE